MVAWRMEVLCYMYNKEGRETTKKIESYHFLSNAITFDKGFRESWTLGLILVLVFVGKIQSVNTMDNNCPKSHQINSRNSLKNTLLPVFFLSRRLR